MRILSMHKADRDTEAGRLPSPEFMAGMGALMEEMGRAGVLRSGEGLRPSSTGARLRFKGGKRTLTKGPFRGENELLAGLFLVRVKSLDEALDWAGRFAEGYGDVEIDVRPLTEPWDLGFGPKPAGLATTRFMLAYKADARSEAGVPLAPERAAALAALTADMQRAGVLLAFERLQPSAKAVRLHFRGGQRRAVDGPFAESKELIAGYAELEVASMAEGIEWATRFARLFPEVEIDIRRVHEG